MINKEAKGSLFFSVIILIAGILLYMNDINYSFLLIVIGSFFLLFFLQFFRNPIRIIENENNDEIYAPADGKVVVIEKVFEAEYYKEERMQISIFMSPINVHVNRSPFNGVVKYKKYHKGKFLMAFNPKSSLENERCTTVFENENGNSILYRQIAGFLARRIMNYVDNGTKVKRGEDYGFIKLGSRVDIFLPLNATINVKLDQTVLGNIDKIASF